MDRSTGDLIYGVHPVEEFLKQYPNRARELVVREGSLKGLGALMRRARQSGLRVKVLSNADFNRQQGDRRFQGVFLVTTPFEYADLDGLEIDNDTLLLALDSVKDPQNLGSLLRSAVFFGVRAVILPRDRSVRVTSTVIRTSAGAAFRVPVCQVTNLARTLRALKKKGMWVIGADSNQGKPLAGLDPPRPLVLVLGAEDEGLRRNVKNNCDLLVKIDTGMGFDSLNVAVAGGILIHALATGK